MALCGQLSGLVEVPRSRLAMFQNRGGQENTLTENRSLLQSLTGHIVRPDSGVLQTVPLTVLELLLPPGRHLLAPSAAASSLAFPDLMAVIAGLASMGAGAGHLILFPAALDWLIAQKYRGGRWGIPGGLERPSSSWLSWLTPLPVVAAHSDESLFPMVGKA